jgi:ABC-type bacteriocin/lantibiotic exporter with double-glycine peptidase domain
MGFTLTAASPGKDDEAADDSYSPWRRWEFFVSEVNADRGSMPIGDFLPQYVRTNVVRDIVAHLSLFLRLERRMLGIIASYAVAIGLFMLGVPIAVQELVSTFSFAVEPRMILTLALAVAGTLMGVAAFRVLQARAVETLNQRLYTRVAVAFTEALPRLREDHFLPQHAYRFMEADLLTRALAAMTADLFNVVVVGSIGMTMLVFYHPFFAAYNLALVAGFVFLVSLFGRGGFLITLDMSRLHYEIFHWMQNIALNLAHLRAAGSSPYLLHKTDALTRAYVKVRQRRSDLLTGRQYKAASLWHVAGHSGLIAMAGLLVAEGQLTVGQFAAAEVIVGNLLLNLDTLARRIAVLFFAFVSFREMAGFFALPKEVPLPKVHLPIARFGEGVTVTGKNLAFAYPGSAPLFSHFNLEVAPGEKVAVLCRSSTEKTALAKVLAGLYAPTAGVVRYNDMNLVDLSMDSISSCRGLVLDSHPTLLDGTLEDNIVLGRPSISFDDIQWALRFVELEEEVDALPDGLRTMVTGHGKDFTLSQILRILVARAIVTRPRLLIFDGTLHSMIPSLREVLLRRLCSKEEEWSVIFVSNDPSFTSYVDRHVLLR